MAMMMIMLTNSWLMPMTPILMRLLSTPIPVIRGPIGGIRYSGTSSISANVGQGKATLATPDGRHAGTPLAEGCSPEHSMDKKDQLQY